MASSSQSTILKKEQSLFLKIANCRPITRSLARKSKCLVRHARNRKSTPAKLSKVSARSTTIQSICKSWASSVISCSMSRTIRLTTKRPSSMDFAMRLETVNQWSILLTCWSDCTKKSSCTCTLTLASRLTNQIGTFLISINPCSCMILTKHISSKLIPKIFPGHKPNIRIIEAYRLLQQNLIQEA